MGILLDLEVLKELIRRPIQALIGFVCQYGLMPLIAYSITKVFRYESFYGLGLFVVGCCPGGWASNQWTVLFDGDLNLSVFMSFTSTVASFFMMPFWLYTLGERAYLRDLKIRIPFANLTQSLLTIIGPLGIGMLVVHCCPKIKPIVTRIVKPMLLILILYFFVFGAFVNFYLFRYLSLRIALSAPLLPWLGFILGGLFAWIFRQDWSRIKTVGIETGKIPTTQRFCLLFFFFHIVRYSKCWHCIHGFTLFVSRTRKYPSVCYSSYCCLSISSTVSSDSPRSIYISEMSETGKTCSLRI